MTELIPRKLLFGNPEKIGIKISPDGKWISYLAPSKKNVLNIWVQKIGENKAEMVTQDEYRGIRMYAWSYKKDTILYQQDQHGNEDWHLYITNIQTKETMNATPFKGVRVQNIIIHKDFPDFIYIGLNKLNPELFDIYKLDLQSLDISLNIKNWGNVLAWGKDHNFVVRTASGIDPATGEHIIYVRENEAESFRELLRVPFYEEIYVLEFTEDNKNLYFLSSLDANTIGIVETDFYSGKTIREIVRHPKADISNTIVHPVTHVIQAVASNYLKREWQFFDKEVEKNFKIFNSIGDGNVHLVSRDNNDIIWIIAYESDTTPVKYYSFDKQTGKLTFLFDSQPKLNPYNYVKIKPIIIKASDGMELVSYLTVPDREGPNPLVLLVHGGPWSRDLWGWVASVQWLANRGYAVLQVNYRGSSGFGKEFLNAGNKEWGTGKMQQDLTGAVNWAINENIALPDKIAIFGYSYGGYAVLAGLAFTPDLYCCGVDVVGPSNLKTLIKSIPPYWKPAKKNILLRIGDVEKDSEYNKKISPLYHAEKIKKPLIIAQGAIDPRVKKDESDQIVKAMRAKSIPVTYIIFPDEGHGFARPENRMEFYARIESFLFKHLGGRTEQYTPVKGSTAEDF